MLNSPEFAKRVRDERVRLKLTQQKLALALNVDRATVSGYENARTHPDIAILKRMECAGLDVDYLLYGVGRKPTQFDWQFARRLLRAVTDYSLSVGLRLTSDDAFDATKLLYEAMAPNSAFPEQAAVGAAVRSTLYRPSGTTARAATLP